MEKDRKTLGQLLEEGVDCQGFLFQSSVQVNYKGSTLYAYHSCEGNELRVFPKLGEYEKPVGINLDQHMNDPLVG